MRLTERRSGLPFELDDNTYALIIRTYQRVYRTKQVYWIAGGVGVMILWYLGYTPWWVVPIIAVLFMVVNYVLSLKTLAWLSRKTSFEAHEVYGIYLDYLRGNIEGIREELYRADRDDET